MPSFNDDPASFVDLHTFFPTLDQNVGLSHEQVRAIIENIYWNYNHLSEANIEIGETRVIYAPAGSPFDVDISHRRQYDEHGCVIKDIWDFVFTVAVAGITASASATAGETAAVSVTPTELQDHTGYNFAFAFTLPRGLQGIQGASFRVKGAYDSTQTYVNNSTYIDCVYYDGNMYAAIVAQTTAGTLPTDTTEWAMLVRRGYGISTVTKTGTSGLVDTYTITYEDGSTSTFEITNGATPDISGKADKVANATAGNIATLDANGNLTDSGIAPTDLQENLGITAQDIQDAVAQISYLTTETVRLNNNKQDIIQYDTLPTASASNVGAIVQYIGTTDSTYTNGHFYKSTENSGTYSWVEVEFSGSAPSNMVTTNTAQTINAQKSFGNSIGLRDVRMFGKFGYGISAGTPSMNYIQVDSTGFTYYKQFGNSLYEFADVISTRETISSGSAISARLGATYLYTGETANGYTQYHFYKCMYDETNSSYYWLDVTPTGGTSSTILTNVSASTWVADSTYTGFGYKCVLTATGVTANDYAEVVFGVTEAMSGNYAPIAETGADTITIYSKVDTSITIPTIKVDAV